MSQPMGESESLLFTRIGGRSQGPYSMEQLRTMVRRGILGRLHEVSQDGRNWQRATDYAELFITDSPANVKVLALEDAEVELELQPPIPSPPVVVPPPAPQWHYSQSGERRGPVSQSELEQLIRSGLVRSSDMVWTEGLNSWTAVSAMPSLIPSLHYSPNSVRLDNTQRIEIRHDAPRTSSLAVASLVLGLLGCTIIPLLGSLLAVLFGHGALREVDGSGGKVTGSALAVAGMVLGYLVLIPAALFLLFVFFMAVLAAL